MVRTTTQPYEVSSESGRERVVRIPYARQEDATPVLHDPAAILSAVGPGIEATGTILTLDTVNSMATINIAQGATYWHNVRNVLTYGGGVEATWGPINIGDPIYYDRSATMPATTKLSTSPLDNTGAANSLFGWAVVAWNREGAAAFPKGAALVASTQEVAVMQK